MQGDSEAALNRTFIKHLHCLVRYDHYLTSLSKLSSVVCAIDYCYPILLRKNLRHQEIDGLWQGVETRQSDFRVGARHCPKTGPGMEAPSWFMSMIDIKEIRQHYEYISVVRFVIAQSSYNLKLKHC